MDKYQRVEKPRNAERGEHVDANEIRITQQGKVRNYISYANGLFTDKSERRVVLKAMGNAISKAVTVAEILKHRIAHLHQVTQISSIETVDVYEPLEEGLDRIETKRHIPGISIELSLDELDRDDPGYQSPIPVDQVSAASYSYHEEREFRNSRGHGKRSGRRSDRGDDTAASTAAAASIASTADTEGADAAAHKGSEHQVAGDDDTRTSHGRSGKRSRGRARGHGGRNPRARDGSAGGDGVPEAETGANGAAQQQTEDGGVSLAAAGPNPKAGRGRKSTMKERSSADKSDGDKAVSPDDDGADDGEAAQQRSRRGNRGGRGRHSGRGRGRVRSRGRGGRGRESSANGEITSPAAAAEAALAEPVVQ